MNATILPTFDVAADYIDTTGAPIEAGPDIPNVPAVDIADTARGMLDGIRCVVYVFRHTPDGRTMIAEFRDVADIDGWELP